jgi:hypothetical protein
MSATIFDIKPLLLSQDQDRHHEHRQRGRQHGKPDNLVFQRHVHDTSPHLRIANRLKAGNSDQEIAFLPAQARARGTGLKQHSHWGKVAE